MMSNVEWCMAATNKVVPETVTKLIQWQKEGAVSENTGISNQRQRATVNSAGGIASPS